MNRVKKTVALLIVISVLLAASACGGTENLGSYTKLYGFGKSEYNIAFRAGDRACDTVTAALKVLAADGTLAGLSQKWFGADNVTLEGDLTALEELSAQEEIARRVFIIGFDPGATGMSGRISGDNYEGFDIDAAQAVCGVLGWELRMIPIDPDDMLIELKSGNIDAAWGAMSAAASDSISVSPAYMEYERIIVTRSDAEIKRLGKLGGGTLGVESETVAAALMASEKDTAKLDVTFAVYDSVAASFRALDAGEVDAILVSSVTARSYL